MRISDWSSDVCSSDLAGCSQRGRVKPLDLSRRSGKCCGMSVDQFHASLRSWEPAALASRWQTLEAKGKSSFFLGWTWTGAWLAATGVRPDLLAVQVGGRIGRASCRERVCKYV